MADVSSRDHWSLEAVPEDQRPALLREVYGPSLNMDITPLAPNPIFEIELMPLPGIMVLQGRNSPHRVARANVARENDDFVLGWSRLAGPGTMTQRGREVRDGTAVLFSCAEPFSSDMHSEFRVVNVRFPRALIASVLPDPDDACMRPIPTDRPALRLLNTYLDILRREKAPGSAECIAVIAGHIGDLVALSVGAQHDVDAFTGGMRAARLAAVKRWARARLHEPGLSVADAAAAERVSVRYIQMLFEAEGTTFSAFVLKERLASVRRQLSSPLSARTPISALAFDSGFGDLSYFNRTFRAAYGEAPSDVRHRAAPHNG